MAKRKSKRNIKDTNAGGVAIILCVIVIMVCFMAGASALTAVVGL